MSDNKSQEKISHVLPVAGNNDDQFVPMEDSNNERTLGVFLYAKKDVIRFKVRIKLSPLNIPLNY